MAGNKRPSFLKRQKEQARKAKAIEKREARTARRIANASGAEATDMPEDFLDSMMPPDDDAGDERLGDAEAEAVAPSEREPR